MTEIITDTHQFTINVIQHPNVEIINTIIPTEVESGDQFTIEYEIKNNGASGNCWGHIKDVDNDTILAGSEWTGSMNTDDVLTKTFVVSDGITNPFNGKIEVGYTN